MEFLQIARATEPPKDLMANKIPLVMAIKCGGALSCAAVTRYVKLHPRPIPRKTGYPHIAAAVDNFAAAMSAGSS